MDAQVAELVDALDLKSSGHCGRAGSTPAPGTHTKLIRLRMSFFVSRQLFYLSSQIL